MAPSTIQVWTPPSKRKQADEVLAASPNQAFPYTGGDPTPDKKRRVRQKSKAKDAAADAQSALELLPRQYAEDYWNSPTVARLPSGDLLHQLLTYKQREAGEAAKSAARSKSVESLLAAKQNAWLGRLSRGFSLLFEGIGSKHRLLQGLTQVLKRSGFQVGTMKAFVKGSSLTAFLRELGGHLGLQRVGASLPRIVAALLAARREQQKPAPFVLVIHNLEEIPPAQQTALASLVAGEEFRLVASVDNLWADLACSLDAFKDFKFCREEVHTMACYDAELEGRYPEGLPACSDPFAVQKETKVSIGLVLGGLTAHHQELVQAMAKNQLSGGGKEGVNLKDLLDMAEDLLIASNLTKLRRFLNELTDHQIVVERRASDGTPVFVLPVAEGVLRKLARGEKLGEEGNDAADDLDGDDEDGSFEEDDVDAK